MCGRFSLDTTKTEIAREFKCKEVAYDVEERKELLGSLPQIKLQVHPVSKAVNSPKNDSPECVEPI